MYGGAPYGSRPLGSNRGTNAASVSYQFVVRFVVYITFVARFAWKFKVKKLVVYITQRSKFPWRAKQ